MSLDPYLADFSAQSPTAVETITRILRQAILEGALMGGTLLRQGDLAKKLGVSRIPVREALLKLEGEGLVETQPRHGVVVTSLTAEDFKEILQMRYALESLALELAIPHFSKADLDDALQMVAQANASMSVDSDRQLREEFESRWGELNWQFHKRLYQVARRPRLLSSIENLQQLFARQLRVHIKDHAQQHLQGDANPAFSPLRANRDEWERVIEEHQQIALACADHDPQRAKEILERHIFVHGEQVVQRLRQAERAKSGAGGN